MLGKLTGEGLEQFEQQLFADDNLFAEVLIAEDELIDESLANELNETEREFFAKNFLNSPERKQKLLFRRVLKGYVERKKPRREAARRWSFLPAAVYSFRTAITSVALVIIAALIAIVPMMRTPTFATINLSIVSNERALGTEIRKLKLPLGVDELRLQLALPEPETPAPSYRVELVNAGGQKRTLETISKDEKTVVVAISASQLEPGQYAVNLYATRPGETAQRIAGSYYFIVE